MLRAARRQSEVSAVSGQNRAAGVALVNGYVGNTWRIQMVQTAKAYAEQPDVKPDIAEFKVVSVGEDVPAQIGAIDQFINAGYRRDRNDRQQLDLIRSGDGPRRGRQRGGGSVRRGGQFGQGHHG